MNWMRYSMLALCLTIGACANTPQSNKRPADPQGQANSNNTDAQTQGSNYDVVNGQALSTQVKNAPTQRLVYFDYDISQLSINSRQILDQHVSYLHAHPQLRVRIEGHADERGSREYNLALGEQRALSVQRYLSISGIAETRLSVFSYGEEKPVSLGNDNRAWQQNRRAELIY